MAASGGQAPLCSIANVAPECATHNAEWVVEWLPAALKTKFKTKRRTKFKGHSQRPHLLKGAKDAASPLNSSLLTPAKKIQKNKDRDRHQRFPRALMVEFVNYGDVGVDFDGETVEERGFVAPLVHGIECRLIEEWVTFQHLKRTDGAVIGDDGVEFDGAFAAHLEAERGVGGLDAMCEQRGVDVSHVNDAGCGRARDCGLGMSALQRNAVRALRLRSGISQAGWFLDSL